MPAIIFSLSLSGCNNEPKYTAEEWKNKQTEINTQITSNNIETVTVTTETEIEIFNKELRGYQEFFIKYLDLIKSYEDKWLDIISINSIGKYSGEEILNVTLEEKNAVQKILVFPNILTQFLNYEISYIDARGKYYGTLAFAMASLKRSTGVIDTNVINKIYPNWEKDKEVMDNLYEKTENELRNILIDYNKRAKKLGLSTPFPNQ